MNSELFLKVIRREEKMNSIKVFLLFLETALHLAIMPGRVGANKLMLNTQLSGSFLKKGLDIPFTVGKTLCNEKMFSAWTHST